MNYAKLVDKRKKEICALGDELFATPELGYKEFETKKKLTKLFNDNGLQIKELGFETAFSVTIGKGKPHIGLIAELDGLPTPGHPKASKVDNAAHSCGHSTQCTIMAETLILLKDIIKKGSVTLFFTPAEEYTDVDYREKIIKEGKINYIGGKVNMLAANQFDDIDMIIHCHTMSECEYHFTLNSSLSGFVYKEITFKGKAAHAAIAPHLGVNALNAFVLFDDALNMLRETFEEKDYIRIHGRLKEAGATVNSIPDKVVYECYVRSMNEESLLDVQNKIDIAAKSCAKAIGASATIKTKPGYLPIIQNETINEYILQEMLRYCDLKDIHNYEMCMAAADLGDVSLFVPTVQFGYSGFKGVCHGIDLCVDDYNRAYIEPIKIVLNTVMHYLENPKEVDKIKKDFKPKMSKKQYLDYINSK